MKGLIGLIAYLGPGVGGSYPSLSIYPIGHRPDTTPKLLTRSGGLVPLNTSSSCAGAILRSAQYGVDPRWEAPTGAPSPGLCAVEEILFIPTAGEAALLRADLPDFRRPDPSAAISNQPSLLSPSRPPEEARAHRPATPRHSVSQITPAGRLQSRFRNTRKRPPPQRLRSCRVVFSDSGRQLSTFLDGNAPRRVRRAHRLHSRLRGASWLSLLQGDIRFCRDNIALTSAMHGVHRTSQSMWA